MTNQLYTIITFAPVQGFIEKSRKLRDLYGSSYILSFLSWAICQEAEKQGCTVVSPALPNVTQGMPNQIIIKGDFSKENAEKAFHQAWKCITDTCRKWIENNIQGCEYSLWRRDWQLWTKHCWEFFWTQGKLNESITKVRQRLNQVKHSRNWIGINWQGESSTLSGTDAIAYPTKLAKNAHSYSYNYQQEKEQVKDFYKKLSEKLGESFIDATPNLKIKDKDKTEYSKKYGSAFIEPREELSIPELTKRLITHKVIVNDLVECLRKKGVSVSEKDFTQIEKDLNPQSFRELNRLKDDSQENTEEKKYWTGWFLGDGDSASKYFQMLGKLGDKVEEEGTKAFSYKMREWGRNLQDKQEQYFQNGLLRMIYAGGDDFLGVLYHPDYQISPQVCFEWFCSFKSKIWNCKLDITLETLIFLSRLVSESLLLWLMAVLSHIKEINSSVGFVWAAPQVPQRDVLQHCRDAEKSAKSQGRDRIAFRVLFNSGNYLEWVCPWWLLEKGFIKSYHDRQGESNWNNFYEDVATLESRHAFDGVQIKIALGLIKIYFGQEYRKILANSKYWWNQDDEYEMRIFTGILGDKKQVKVRDESNPRKKHPLSEWVINLAKVGFYLTDKK